MTPTNITSTNTQFDIIIVGGGLIGNTLALALGQQSLRIALIEANEFTMSWPNPTYDLRVSAITQASQQIFESLGVWSTMTAKRVTPFSDMHVWDATGMGQIHFSATDIGSPRLGHIIENKIIISSLLDALHSLDNVSMIRPVRCQQLSISSTNVTLSLSNAQQLTSQLIVGADGSASWVRQQVAINCNHWSYEQTGIVATISTEHSHQNTAWQRFLPTGPLACLPLPNHHCSIVWSHQQNTAQQLLTLSDETFTQALQTALGDSPLGRIESISSRAGFPLRLQHAKQYTKPRVALIGDAAHTIHPLAGQGANLGLMDVACLAEVLTQAQHNQLDLGEHLILRRYERWRKAHNLLTMGAMDGLKRLFCNEFKPAISARNTGLNLTHLISPLKNYLTQYAMGQHHDLPPLAKNRALSDQSLSGH